MVRLIKCNLYKLLKTKKMWYLTFIALIISLILNLIVFGDIRLGVSIFGNSVNFINTKDIFIMSSLFYKGLGFIVAILIPLFIGEEFSNGELQNKIAFKNSRTKIYISSLVTSIIITNILVLIFNIPTVLFSVSEINNYIYLFNNIIIYTCLATVFTTLSFIAKNSIVALISCLLYVSLVESILSLLITKFDIFLLDLSLYSISNQLSSVEISNYILLCVYAIVNMLIYIIIGIIAFRKSEV